MTWREALVWGRNTLKEKNVPDYHIDAKILIETVLQIHYGEFILSENKEMPEANRRRYQALIEKRSERIPLQYIINDANFMGLSFRVNRDVLIPRQDTECIVERILPSAKNKRILDLCTGSGCIGISIAALEKSAEVHCSDISEAAVRTAGENAKANRVTIKCIQSDLFEKIIEKYDIIVSNPPYIKTGDISSLMPEVRDYEPKAALDGGEDGYNFYRRIISSASSFLNSGGLLVLEIGYDQAEYVSGYMKKNGFSQVETGKDLAGNDRMISGVRKKNMNGTKV